MQHNYYSVIYSFGCIIIFGYNTVRWYSWLQLIRCGHLVNLLLNTNNHSRQHNYYCVIYSFGCDISVLYSFSNQPYQKPRQCVTPSKIYWTNPRYNRTFSTLSLFGLRKNKSLPLKRMFITNIKILTYQQVQCLISACATRNILRVYNSYIYIRHDDLYNKTKKRTNHVI